MNNRNFVFFIVVLCTFILTSCAYNHKQFPTEGGPLTGPEDFVIQIDDYGRFWDASTPELALEKIEELAETSNVIVMLFVHGWNHDARPNNSNLDKFASTVADTRRRLIDISNPESFIYRESRRHLTGSESLSIVSVYVGWRGRSLPGFLNYATFWGRKAAAERVGTGDLREFLAKLNALYRERRELRASGATPYFLGMTSFGHSFGAQALFRSVVYDIESELIAKTSRERSRDKTPDTIELLGFGDLVVLVNPAFEALQFERIWRLSNEIEFGKQQNPVMLVISSAGDIPRQVLFPIGRNMDALFLRPGFRPGQRALWTQALGEYENFRTHSIEVIPDASPLTPTFSPEDYTENPCVIANLDLTNIPAISGVRLTPTGSHQENNPFVIAHASTSVVLNHSKVFEETLRKFLNDYIAISQGKRMLTGHSAQHCN